MIQRIQTVWLLLAMACAVLLLYFPVWQALPGIEATGMEQIGAGTHFFLLPIPAILFLTHAYAIWSFKKRKRQLRLCGINITLFILFVISALIIVQTERNVFDNFNISEFRMGFILPLIGIIFNFTARRGIKKDEELIRSMDRLR